MNLKQSSAGEKSEFFSAGWVAVSCGEEAEASGGYRQIKWMNEDKAENVETIEVIPFDIKHCTAGLLSRKRISRLRLNSYLSE